MIRLAIVEDNSGYLRALKLYLGKAQNIQLVQNATNLQSLPVLIATKPDVVIMDINIGADSGIKGVQLIKKALPQTAILMLMVFYDEEKIARSIQAGASDYLLKKDSPKKIVEAISHLFESKDTIGAVPKTICDTDI